MKTEHYTSTSIPNTFDTLGEAVSRVEQLKRLVSQIAGRLVGYAPDQAAGATSDGLGGLDRPIFEQARADAIRIIQSVGEMEADLQRILNELPGVSIPLNDVPKQQYDSLHGQTMSDYFGTKRIR